MTSSAQLPPGGGGIRDLAAERARAPRPYRTKTPGPPPPAKAAAPAVVRNRAAVLTVALAVALLAAVVLAAGVGAYHVSPGDVLSSAAHRLRLGGDSLGRVGESVLWNVRLPRVVLALIVGASLGCAGALMQGVFGNPLAEPGVIGISMGAAVGAVAAIALGIDVFGNWTVSAFAFLSGLATVLLVYALSRSGGRTEVVTLILTGIAVNAFAGALIGLFIFFADNAQVTQITFWQLGSLSQATWPKVLAVLPCAVVGLAVAPVYARKLDLLALGERPARHLGVDVERLRIALVLVVALLTAAAVAVAGVITFVGLLVPHLLRMAAGPGHRFLVLVVADLAARTVAEPAELPLGVLTALVGSPFFFWLLRRTRRRQGGLGMIRTLLGARPGRPLPEPLPAGGTAAEARGLVVRLGGRPVLDGVSLTATAGRLTALVGPNGAGKSTLLAALAGDLAPEAGEVRLGGRDVAGWSPAELALRRSVLPQSATLAFPFPVGDVVRMGRAPWSGTPAEDAADEAVAWALAVTETAEFAERPFAELSGGERARVALARVLAQRAGLLLLDEPTAALDLRQQELVLRLARERAAAGDAVVVVLHDLGLAAAYADEVTVLDGGRVAACGSPAEVFDGTLLSEVYRHPVEVLPHPRTGAVLVVPRREP